MGWFGKKKDKDGNEVKLSPREEAEGKLKNAVGAIYAVAIISAIMGAIAIIFQIEFLLELGVGIGGLIAGVIYGGLGFWVQKKRSIIGLGLAFGLYVADGVAFIIGNIEAGGRPTAGIAIRVAIAYVMFQGFGAIRQLKSAKVDDDSGSATDAEANPDSNPDPMA